MAAKKAAQVIPFLTKFYNIPIKCNARIILGRLGYFYAIMSLSVQQVTMAKNIFIGQRIKCMYAMVINLRL